MPMTKFKYYQETMSLIVLAIAVPGNKMSMTFTEWFNPFTSLKYCTLLWAILGPMLALIVSIPGHKMRMFLLDNDV